MRFNSSASLRLKDAYYARVEPEAARVIGVFYWSALICTAFVLIVGSTVYGLWEFMQPQLGGQAETNVVIPPKKTFTKASIQKVLQGVEARAERYELQKKAPIPVRDPS